jgi:hypothetical protein
MANTKRRVTYSTDGNIEMPESNRLPGHTVDALLAAGDIEGAKAELSVSAWKVLILVNPSR